MTISVSHGLYVLDQYIDGKKKIWQEQVANIQGINIIFLKKYSILKIDNT